MYPTALLMLALDDRDQAPIRALVANAARLGVRRLVAAHACAVAPLPEPLSGLASQAAMPRPHGLDAALASLREGLPSCEVVGVHAVGDTRAETARLLQAEDVDLLVIGRDRSPHGRNALGTTGLKLLREVACCALVVPDGSTLDLASVVVGMDFSSNATAGLAVATALAGQVDAVFQYDLRALGTGSMTDDEFHDHFTHNAVKHFHELVLDAVEVPAPPRLAVIQGHDPATVLIHAARGRPIVVGSRGMSPFAATLLGSTAERIAGRAASPVLVVRKKGEQIGFFKALVHR